MTAKQWLSRARRVDLEITTLIRTYEETRDRLTNVTQRLTGETVQSTKDPHKFDRLAELGGAVDERIDELVALKTETVAAINKLPDEGQRAVLLRRYVAGETFEQIAVELNYSWRQVCRIHGYGLTEMERILTDELAE